MSNRIQFEQLQKRRKEKPRYINYKFSNETGTETIDEANNLKKAKELLLNYELSDPFGEYWISQKPCKAWLSK